MCLHITFLCFFAACTNSYQEYPSEYVCHENSVTRAEHASANCMNYLPGSATAGIHPENYIHCNGTQLILTDSNLGSEQYSSSEYYVWPAGARSSQLLFIFPSRVNLTTITLYYYSDSTRNLPKLRFFTVPDNFDIWDSPTASHRYVEHSAVPTGGEPAGRRNVRVSANFTTHTKKVLLFKFGSQFSFAVSEFEFISKLFGHNLANVVYKALFMIGATNCIATISNTQPKSDITSVI